MIISTAPGVARMRSMFPNSHQLLTHGLQCKQKAPPSLTGLLWSMTKSGLRNIATLGGHVTLRQPDISCPTGAIPLCTFPPVHIACRANSRECERCELPGGNQS